jgi:MerR family mercuric resistance operon transcriptional regulator
MKGLTIGKVAKKAGVSVDTVRFYEQRGLIAEPARTPANYRIYPEEDIGRLTFIKKAKELGFSLSEIHKLLTLQDDPEASMAEVKVWTAAKISDIRYRITDLSRILAALEQLAQTCDGEGPISACPILAALTDAPDKTKHHHHRGGAS